MTTLLVVTGASSGIGAAFVAQAPEEWRLTTVSRRPSAGSWIECDLADPASWARVREAVDAELDEVRPSAAVLAHFSGTADPVAGVIAADPDEFSRATLLNSAAGPVLAQSFLRSCDSRAIPCTVVICGSPAAERIIPMQSHYSSGKAGMQRWAATVAVELDGSPHRVLTVIPYATLTDMVRAAMERDPATFPMSAHFRALAESGGLATPEDTAGMVWDVVRTGRNGEVVAVGAVPAGS